MEEEIKQLYEAFLKMNEKLSQINSKNEHLESLVNSLSQYILENKGEEITEEEMTILDPFNLGGYKNVSSPNGSVFKVKSRSLCVNGRHVINDGEPVLLCSKCSSIICYQHDKGISPPLCINCIENELGELGPLEIYILDSVNKGIPLNSLRKALKGSYKEFAKSQLKLIREGYLEKDIFFRRVLTLKGNKALVFGSKIYDLSFINENGS